MSEGNERNLESVAPEAAENIERRAAEAPEAEAPEAVQEETSAEREASMAPAGEAASAKKDASAEKAPAAEPASARKDASAGKAPAKAPAKKKGGKKRNHGPLIALALVLIALLVAFAVLVGYGLGRVRGERKLEEAQEQVEQLTAGLDAAQSGDDYDAFTEALTNENQQALDALAGADAPEDAAAALRGDDGFFDDAEEPVVLAEFGDGQTLMSDEVLERYNDELSSYILSGYSEEEVAETLLDDVLRSMVRDRVMEAHARELGVYELDDADRAEIAAQAQASYDEYVRYYRENEISAEGMTEEEANGAAKAYLLDDQGISYDVLAAQLEKDWWERKLYDELTKSVAVDDAKVQAAYDERLAAQKEAFTAYPDDYEFGQKNGETILYNLPGYRAVKVLLLGFDSEEIARTAYSLTNDLYALESEPDAEQEAQRRAELDACYAGPEARAKEALEQLRGGADMDELILSIGQDEGMKSERQLAAGYYVSADSMLWSPDFVSAAMALENVGDYSEPVRVEEGVCILQYLGEVAEGEVPLDSVRDALAEEALSQARDEAFDQQVQAWVDEAKPSYYPERIQ